MSTTTLSSAMPTPEPAAVTFKITLRPHGPTRVATFAQRPGWADLAARVAGLFDLPSARGGSIALAYTDADGDEITLDTEPELAFYYAERDAAGDAGSMRFAVSAGGRRGPPGPHRGGPHHRHGHIGWRHRLPSPPPPPGPTPEDDTEAPAPLPEGSPSPRGPHEHPHEHPHGRCRHRDHQRRDGPSDSSDEGSDSDGPGRHSGRRGSRHRGGRRREHDGRGHEHGHEYPWFGHGPFGSGFPFRGGWGRGDHWGRWGSFSGLPFPFPFAPPFAGGDCRMPPAPGVC